MKCIALLFYSAHYSTYSTRRRLILFIVTGSGTLILCNVQLTMKFKLFNATIMHNSTEKWEKIKKSKKSDLNQKKSDFFDFFY